MTIVKFNRQHNAVKSIAYLRVGLLSLILILTNTYGYTQTNKETITNKTILDLKSAGISKEIMKSMISTATNYKFDTDAQSVIKLKKAGIDDEVISAMIHKSSGEAANAPAIAKPVANNENSNVPATGIVPSEVLKSKGSGIYYMQAQEFIEIEPTVYSGKKESPGVLRSITYGIAKSTTRRTLNTNEANLTVENKKPVFYFVFDKSNNSLNDQASGWFSGVSSPNEFQLVKIIVKKDKKTGKQTGREVETNASSYYSGSESGVSSKFKVNFKSKKIDEGIYELTFQEDLEAGEYCFMYAGANSDLGMNNPKVYDFAVK
jgi:hypothetical protein